MNASTPGWHPDPTARFEFRYHNGAAWTADVSNNGQRFVDPSGVQIAPPALVRSTPPPGAASNAPIGSAANRMATASMVLGIIAIAIGWMPYVVVVGAVLAVLAVLFGRVGRRRAKDSGVGSGFALAGMITGAAGLVVCVAGALLTVAVTRAIDRFDQPGAHDVEITSCERSGNEWTSRGTLTNRSDGPSSFTVRVFFARTGTDNPRRQALVEVGPVAPGATVDFDVTRAVDLDALDCVVAAVRGPLPFGVDPGT